MPRQYILMGDVIGSSDHDAQQLRRDFMGLVSACNEKLREHLLSPYTVTLGDEFQGVSDSLGSAVESIFFLEESSLRRSLAFKIRYVTVYGEIDTLLNPLKAHTMMGEGLTKARRILTDKRRGTPRFRFDLPDRSLMKQLNRLFFILDGLIDQWKIEDALLIFDMINNGNNREVGIEHGKNRTQIWKRRNHLFIEEYRTLKETILDFTQ